jgi:hypothetical protein
LKSKRESDLLKEQADAAEHLKLREKYLTQLAENSEESRKLGQMLDACNMEIEKLRESSRQTTLSRDFSRELLDQQMNFHGQARDLRLKIARSNRAVQELEVHVGRIEIQLALYPAGVGQNDDLLQVKTLTFGLTEDPILDITGIRPGLVEVRTGVVTGPLDGHGDQFEFEKQNGKWILTKRGKWRA